MGLLMRSLAMGLLMKGPRNWGMLVLAAWLIVTGLTMFVHISFVNITAVSGALALAAGVLILLGR